jgi:ferredoxin
MAPPLQPDAARADRGSAFPSASLRGRGRLGVEMELVATSSPAAAERLRPNAWGPYYVSSDCNGCGLCVYCAPQNFARSIDGTYCAVLHQPLGEGEEQAVVAAMAACPLQCIHDDGDEA